MVSQYVPRFSRTSQASVPQTGQRAQVWSPSAFRLEPDAGKVGLGGVAGLTVASSAFPI
jgi:hypothetical protein